MGIKSIIGAVCACLAVVSANTNATIYSTTFYELNGVATNLFTDYSVSGTATFEINDSAIDPNNLVLFSSIDFLAFDAVMNTSIGGAQFTLGDDGFDEVFLNDGTITTSAVAMANGDGFTPFNGEWSFIQFDSLATTGGNNSYYFDTGCTYPCGGVVIWFRPYLFNRIG